MTVWEFEIHAGSNLKMPYANINVIRTCSSLLKHQIHLWNEKKKPAHRNFNHVGPIPGATDSNDDACQICADGGELICCEKCPSTFHPSCLEMERIPQGDWLCSYCVCIFCDGGNGDMLTCQQCEKKCFYTLILEKNDAIVSAATIRMHGNDLAEMPFIGTRERYRFKGLSRMLFDALGYEKYGFRPIDDVVKPKLINYNTLMFPCTVRLQKTFPDISASSSRAMDIGANEKSLKLALLDLNLDPPEPADDELAKPVAWNE
ncbi:hypothetical protein GH714_038131 [Hevea brasiliensis]|uniref:PHD-type domain-containing protein n=1 Tax=Hevea brasiliensis TaxID=3981 RepID=A0A6A6MR73_HEVBR|nr:hypothetical protein GH714_038131 [Hevea brasiliensis]